MLVFFHQWNWVNNERKFHLISDTVISKDISGVSFCVKNFLQFDNVVNVCSVEVI